MSERYRWAGPHEWLAEKIDDAEADELRGILNSVFDKLDADTIQDVFQSDMEADGYFVDLDKEQAHEAI